MSVGLNLFRRIVLPPVILAAIPMIGNQLIQIIKDSVFPTIIAVPELTDEASSIQATYFVPFAAFVTAVLLYWGLRIIVEAGGRGWSHGGGAAMTEAVAQPAAELPVLEVRSVSKSFGSLQVLSDISLKVARSEPCASSGRPDRANRPSYAASTGSKSPIWAPCF